jgi:Partial alpha/beta-hydrolase lipase region
VLFWSATLPVLSWTTTFKIIKMEKMKTSILALTLSLTSGLFIEKAESFGYKASLHEFKTNDAYILTLGRLTPVDQKSPPVLLLPDIFMSMDSWLDHTEKPEQSLPL